MLSGEQNWNMKRTCWWELLQKQKLSVLLKQETDRKKKFQYISKYND
jgi:hypothetical protein